MLYGGAAMSRRRDLWLNFEEFGIVGVVWWCIDGSKKGPIVSKNFVW